MPTDPTRVQAVFVAAAEIADPAARASFLAQTCGGDQDLKARVEILLLAHDQPDSLFDAPLVTPPDANHAATRAFAPNPDADAPRQGAGGDDPSDDEPLTFLSPSARPDSLGRIGHYEVLQVLGKGGFGIVFRAFDDILQRVVAVKVLAPRLAATSPARKRFLREARNSAAVRHENVVQVYEVAEQPLPYLAMEFIPGETLQQRIDRTGPIDVSEVLRIGRQVAEGLAAAHARNLIHRDIKPGNILLEGGSQKVKITDFGLARAADDASISQSGIIAGTPMYMAPEQAHGDGLDHRADLFSLGSVLYVMCSGRPPFRASSTLAVLKRVAEDTPRPIPEIIPEVPPWLCDLITRLHAKKAEDRIATAREVADLLGQGLAAMQQPAPVPSPPVIAPVAGEKVPQGNTSSAGGVELPRPAPALKPRPRVRRWASAAAVFLLLLGGLGFTEATEVTNVRGTVIRLFSPEGTLEVQVDDPGVSVQIDGSDLVITGAGAREIRLKPGSYTVEARKDGKVVSRELVTVTKNGKQVVRVSQEARPPGPVEDTPEQKAAKAVKAAEENAARVAQLAAEVAAKVRAQQKAAATQLGITVETTNSIGMELRLIPAGTFTMGSTRYYQNGYQNESPEHEVEITKPFFMGATDVTVGQYRRFVKEKNYKGGNDHWQKPPHHSEEQIDNHPVVLVSWNNAVDFCNWLSEKEGKKYRLPTEAEWEYSCRAGTKTDFSFGDDPAELWRYAWVDANSQQKVHPVKGRLPNAWGLYDMHGNVREWCQDFYDANYYKTGPRQNPQGPSDGAGRVVRGGEAHYSAMLCRSSHRGASAQSAEWGFTSFRVVQDVSAPGSVRPYSPANGDGAGAAADDPDRRAAGYVLSIGGEVGINGSGVRAVAELPQGAFRLTAVLLNQNKKVTDAGMAVFENCTNVTELHLYECRQVTDAGMAYFKGCKNLTHLGLGGTAITDAGLIRFKDCKNLRSLHLQGTAVTDAGLANFTDCKNLTDLHLANNENVTDSVLAHFKDCKNLKHLQLSYTNVTDAGMAYLKDCKNLEGIFLYATQVTDVGLAHLNACKNLTVLDLRIATITDARLAQFKDCKNLTILQLQGGRQITDAGLAHLAGLNKLTYLNLADTQVTAQGVAGLARKLPKCKITWDGGVIEPE